MIQNWEISSRIDKQTGTVYHTLLIDGSISDARIIAKKLKGYVAEPTVAEAPYVFAFALPNDVDDETKEKIRTAVEEAVQLSQKIDQFIPGGSLGDPLFKNTTQWAYPTFLQAQNTALPKAVDLGEATRFFKVQDEKVAPTTPQPPASSQEQAPQVAPIVSPETNLKDTEAVDLQAQTISIPAGPAPDSETSTPIGTEQSTISISDNDMLIKDMEGSVLEKMPLEDILSAETKYDVFVDVDNSAQQVQKTQQTKEQKISQAQPEKMATFNVFEHELKDQTNIIDVEDVQTITDRLTNKKMDFMNNQPEEKNKPAAPQSGDIPTVPAQSTEPEDTPFTLGARAVSKTGCCPPSVETII